MIITLDSVESTNRYCELLDPDSVGEFTCYRAIEQTAGIGQRGNTWYSGAAGDNLTFSIILKPTFLPAAAQFRLTQAISLALCDLLSAFTGHLSPLIKWPNDIYVDGHKICGTLTSVRFRHRSHRPANLEGGSEYTPLPPSRGEGDSQIPSRGEGDSQIPSRGEMVGIPTPSGSRPPLRGAGGCDIINSAVCGIGLNVNQMEFPDWIPHPTSLAMLTGRRHDTDTLLPQLLDACRIRYEQLRLGHDPTEEYLAKLMNLGRACHYIYDGQHITATITGVDSYGRLLLTDGGGRRLCCAMKEIALAE